jgi:hypothetical protein
VTVTQAATLDVAVSGSQTYGGSPSFRGTDKAPAGITVDTSGLKCTTVGSSTTIAPNLPVATGPYTLLGSSCSGATLSGTDAATYAIAYTSAPNDFTVTPAVLTVTASSGTMTYGSPVPSITAAYTGFVNGQTSSALTSRPSCSTTVTSSSPVSGSPYVTSCGDAVDPNYAFTYDGGSVKVNQAQLTITASSGTMTYGGTVPTITAGYSGFVNGETPLNLTTLPICATTATNSSSSSSSAYPTSCTGAADSNYGITYVAGSVSVASAPLDVAVSGSQTYGGSPSFSGTDTAPSGVTVTTTDLNCTTIRASTTIVPSLAVAGGPYTLLASSCSGATLSGANAADYSIAYTSAASDFTVSAAPLQITASSTNVIYGTVPTITPMATGFLNGDTLSSLTTQPTCSTTVTSSSPVSPPNYPSSCSGASDPNYTISYIAGSITVLPDPGHRGHRF